VITAAIISHLNAVAIVGFLWRLRLRAVAMLGRLSEALGRAVDLDQRIGVASLQDINSYPMGFSCAP